MWSHKIPLLHRVCSAYRKGLKGKMKVALAINSHGCGDGERGSRSWYLMMKKEGQRFMMKTRNHHRAIYCHIKKKKYCSLLGTGRKETGGSWHELSNFLLALTFRCNDWGDEGSAPDGGPIIVSSDTQLRPLSCAELQLRALWAGLPWPLHSPAACTAACVAQSEVFSLLQGFPALFALRISSQ